MAYTLPRPFPRNSGRQPARIPPRGDGYVCGIETRATESLRGSSRERTSVANRTPRINTVATEFLQRPRGGIRRRAQQCGDGERRRQFANNHVSAFHLVPPSCSLIDSHASAQVFCCRESQKFALYNNRPCCRGEPYKCFGPPTQ